MRIARDCGSRRRLLRSARATLLAHAALLALALPTASAAGSCPGAEARPEPANLEVVRMATLCLLNEQRSAHRLQPLVAHDLLTRASTSYAEDMVRRRYFGHVDPEGRTIAQRLAAVGYLEGSSWETGENIAWGEGRLSTPRAAVHAWMQSPSHQENILYPRFREVGLGIALGSPLDGSGARAATYTTDFGFVDRGVPVAPTPAARHSAPAAKPPASAKRAKSPAGAKRAKSPARAKRGQSRCAARRSSRARRRATRTRRRACIRPRATRRRAESTRRR